MNTRERVRERQDRIGKDAGKIEYRDRKSTVN